MKISFSGTKHGMSHEQKFNFFCKINLVVIKFDEGAKIEFHHGNCFGADEEVDAFIRRWCPKWEIHIHPGPNVNMQAFCQLRGESKVYETYPNLVRNRHVVDAGDILIATPLGSEKLRSGTWSAIRYADRKHKPIDILYPDGEIERRNEQCKTST